jgi:hypothetical protein
MLKKLSRASTLLFAIPLLAFTVLGVSQGWYFSPINADAQVGQGYGGNGASYKYTFKSNLKGSEVVPKVKTSMTGNATFNLRNDEKTIDYRIVVQNGRDVTRADLYCAPSKQEVKKVNGPMVANLYSSPNHFDVDGLLVSGTLTSGNILSSAKKCDPAITSMTLLVRALRDGELYVKVNTVGNPNGEVRGEVKQSGVAEIPNGPHSTNPSVSVSNVKPTVNTTVYFNGKGFIPGEKVNVTVKKASKTSSVIQLRASDLGTIATPTLNVGPNKGTADYKFLGLTSGKSATVRIDIQPKQ